MRFSKVLINGQGHKAGLRPSLHRSMGSRRRAGLHVSMWKIRHTGSRAKLPIPRETDFFCLENKRKIFRLSWERFCCTAGAAVILFRPSGHLACSLLNFLSLCLALSVEVSKTQQTDAMEHSECTQSGGDHS